MITIDYNKLEVGMIWHVRTDTTFGKLIRKVLKGVFGNHDGLTAKINDDWFIEESVPFFATLTPINDYIKKIDSGNYQVRIYRVKDATKEKKNKAVEYWLKNIYKTFYDFFAMPRLLWKADIFDLSNSKITWLKKLGDKACGFEWSNWCTEGCATAWLKGANFDVWKKTNPTPLTTEKRVGDTLEDVTQEIIKVW